MRIYVPNEMNAVTRTWWNRRRLFTSSRDSHARIHTDEYTYSHTNTRRTYRQWINNGWLRPESSLRRRHRRRRFKQSLRWTRWTGKVARWDRTPSPPGKLLVYRVQTRRRPTTETERSRLHPRRGSI